MSLALTVKQTRRKRPSFSPSKPSKPSLPERAHSESPTKTPPEDFGIKPIFYPETSALDFNEFSLFNPESKSEPIWSEWHGPFVKYVQKHFGVTDLWICQPFIVLRGEDIPDPADRPFTVAGCIAVWRGLDDPIPPFTPGIHGGQIDKDVFVDDDLVDDLEPYSMPRSETLLALLQRNFPDAAAISVINCDIIVEFEEMENDVWAEKLEALPWGFENITHGLQYTNGLLTNAEYKRLKVPRPRILKSAVVDDSDYVSQIGSFNPGAMLTSDQEDAITSGILVRKGTQERLTVAFHCWDKEYEKNPDKLGDPGHFRVKQADSMAGYVAERIGSTDIGLAKLANVAFDNRFLDIDTRAKRLIPWSQVHTKDEFYIDSFATGPQKLMCTGLRVLGPKGEQDFLRDRKENPPDGSYVVMKQGIYATNDPEILGTPKLRAGMCGSALVRSQRRGEKSNCLHDGEICGFMHWADLAMKYSTSATYYCFADPVDPLIDNGWECAQTAEKRAVSPAASPSDQPEKRHK